MVEEVLIDGVGEDLGKERALVKGCRNGETDRSCKAIGTGDTDPPRATDNRQWRQATRRRKQLSPVGS